MGSTAKARHRRRWRIDGPRPVAFTRHRNRYLRRLVWHWHHGHVFDRRCPHGCGSCTSTSDEPGARRDLRVLHV